jgi:hypothetical protein
VVIFPIFEFWYVLLILGSVAHLDVVFQGSGVRGRWSLAVYGGRWSFGSVKSYPGHDAVLDL